MVYKPFYYWVVIPRPHVQETVGVGLDTELAVVLERGGRGTGMVVQLAARSVGETVGEVCVDVGEGDGAAAGIEVVSGVCSVGLFPD